MLHVWGKRRGSFCKISLSTLYMIDCIELMWTVQRVHIPFLSYSLEKLFVVFRNSIENIRLAINSTMLQSTCAGYFRLKSIMQLQMGQSCVQQVLKWKCVIAYGWGRAYVNATCTYGDSLLHLALPKLKTICFYSRWISVKIHSPSRKQFLVFQCTFASYA